MHLDQTQALVPLDPLEAMAGAEVPETRIHRRCRRALQLCRPPSRACKEATPRVFRMDRVPTLPIRISINLTEGRVVLYDATYTSLRKRLAFDTKNAEEKKNAHHGNLQHLPEKIQSRCGDGGQKSQSAR